MYAMFDGSVLFRMLFFLRYEPRLLACAAVVFTRHPSFYFNTNAIVWFQTHPAMMTTIGYASCIACDEIVLQRTYHSCVPFYWTRDLARDTHIDNLLSFDLASNK